MVLDTNGGGVAEEIKEELPENQTEEGFKGDSGNNEAIDQLRMEEQGWLKAIPTRLNTLRSSSSHNSHSPSSKFRRIAEERDEMSHPVPSSSRHGIRGRFSDTLAQKVDWASLQGICRKWIRSPVNMALLLWIICVVISGAILFLVMTGMLNRVLPKKSLRNTWFEVNNQIINALFTLMCLYQHPKRIYHLTLLCRWQPNDITKLRKIYCKNGTYKPHEWAHMMAVVVLLHVNCFAQYVLCCLNLGYRRSERPFAGVFVTFFVSMAAPASAGVYLIVSPLGKDYDSESDEEAQNQVVDKVSSRRISLQKRYSIALRNEQRIVEYAPTWQGGLLDIWENISIAFFSLFCTFCVFGWNMERLGFGNMYVHIATFLLLCTAPFWVFSLAAVNIDSEGVRQALVITGLVLCLFGLLYGGFWRIQMRKRYNLPGNNISFGKPAIADCAQWLFCCWCSLAQEVRTADFYEIVEDKFCRKQTPEDDQPTGPTLSPLPREDGDQFRSSSPASQLQTNRSPSPSRFGTHSPRLQTNCSPSPSRFSTHSSPSPSKVCKDHYSPGRELPRVEEQSSLHEGDNLMKPPVCPQIRRGEL